MCIYIYTYTYSDIITYIIIYIFTKSALLHVALECDYGAKCPDQQDNGFKGYTWLTRYSYE